MADEVTIQHPVFKDQYYNVPADSAADWEAAGWVKGEPPEGVVVTGPPAGQAPRVREAEATEQPAEAPAEQSKSGKSGKSDKQS